MVENYSKNITKLDYFVAFLFMAFSGNPVFIYTTEWYAIISLIIMFVLCLLNHKQRIDGKISRLLAIFILLSVLQYFFLENVSIPADINQIAKIYVAFLFASFLGTKFRESYLRVITVLAAISLPFWFARFLSENVTFGFEVDRYYSIIIFNTTQNINYNYSSFVRNCGMFWEPGAYSGFLLLVPLMYINNLKELYINNKKSCVILLAALLSAGSTTGYIVLIFLVGPMLLKNIQNPIVRLLFLIIVVVLGFYAFLGLDFLGAKIISEYESASELSQGQSSWTRMGAMQIDLENILRHPFIGNGYLLQSRYGALGELMGGTGNGFTGAINIYGIPMMLIYLCMLSKNIPVVSNRTNFIAVFAVILLLNGEYHLNYSAFWALLFIQYDSEKKYRYIER